MQTSEQTSRRNFIKIAAAAGGGLFLGFNWSNSSALPVVVDAQKVAAGLVNFNSYLSIGTDNVITIISPNPEIGQGIKTAFPMVVAEELDADWKQVKTVQGNLDTGIYERQVTGGSGAVPHSWERLRKAGATARYLLVEAAAAQWSVPASECTTENGKVLHRTSGKSLSYGELAEAASKMPAPAEVKLKKESDFKLIGQSVRNVDNNNIATGKPLFGLDVYREGMLFAMIQRPKAFGLKLKSVQKEAVKSMPGIVDVVTFDNSVAVVGKSTWQVKKAKDALKIEYEKEAELESSADHNRIFQQLMENGEATVRRKNGDVETAFKNAAKVIKSEYQCPFLPHSPLEPMNFFAHVREDGVELIGPTQTPERARTEVAKLTGIAPEKITVEITRQGGGFGRRLAADFVLEAANVSKLVKAPVKVIWTREDDMTGGIYRPAVRYRFEAALDKSGELIGYKLRGVGMNSGNSTREDNFPSGSVENLLIDSVEYKSPITTGPWRAPITNFLAYAEQSFLDEVAEAAGKDPVEFRLALLEKAKKSPVGDIKYDVDRMIGVVKLAAEKSKWGKKKGVYQGFSVYFSHRSYVAQVGEVVMEKGKPVLKNVIAAVDCGIVINKSGSLQQVRGGVVDGLGHAMYGNMTFKDGAPDQRNFNGFRLIRMNEIPEVDVHFVDNGISPTGLGEPALPPAGGAVANAFYKATKQRLRNQPFINEEAFKGIS
ncbi:xanthine dehydrogenase family protein molybdopterin-binding subunit [Dyadobacter sediminis]|uniref:Xanthine dehydrogenase family protein molybdopterin-binding subunit n=1 Tax=Dyadobacter sediminis TaxID=1493691 RepID=A0A5R9K7H5_9BACT|nr:molybdopterin cofactor-binding domain-containing protein [Dyadobacter sediminis]TLU89836.1 xanthine dehydrogenase family protein molybdopterin-binding subunit [Dyadobacter sediminis]GGC12409.1 oxidoreductase subunit beta [Dyadobacter sediminis]